ncbi:MAG: hypothetical protein Q9210_006867 [Variospora velana]
MPSIRNSNCGSSVKGYHPQWSFFRNDSSADNDCMSINRYYRRKPDSYRPSSIDRIIRFSKIPATTHLRALIPLPRKRGVCKARTSIFRTAESTLDYYTRTAPLRYKRRISRHTGIVTTSSPQTFKQTCAATLPAQRTCMHPSTTAGDIVNYIPTGNRNDVPSDAPVPAKLSMHFMVLLPKYYKPIDLQSSPVHHAALVITKNPIGVSTLVAPQPGSDAYKANNVPYFQTLPFDAHSSRRKPVVDETVEKKWVWKENTSVGYQVKIVHQDNLHAVIFPGYPTLGLRLSDGAFQQVLGNLGEEDEELEYKRLVRNVEFWGEADSSRGRRKPSHCVGDGGLAARLSDRTDSVREDRSCRDK